MRRRPTPSLVLSIIAVVFSLAGTSVATITFVRNAGAVDHLSAVPGSSSVKRATGKLVATLKTTGKIPQRFLDLTNVLTGAKGTFHQSLEVTDNATGAPVTIGGFPGLGTLTASCTDQNNKAGIEDPRVTIAFANSSGQPVNIARTVGTSEPTITSLATGTQDTFTINNSNTFRDLVEFNGLDYIAEGVVRQDGAGTATGVCTLWGFALAIPA